MLEKGAFYNENSQIILNQQQIESCKKEMSNYFDGIENARITEIKKNEKIERQKKLAEGLVKMQEFIENHEVHLRTERTMNFKKAMIARGEVSHDIIKDVEGSLVLGVYTKDQGKPKKIGLVEIEYRVSHDYTMTRPTIGIPRSIETTKLEEPTAKIVIEIDGEKIEKEIKGEKEIKAFLWENFFYEFTEIIKEEKEALINKSLNDIR